MTNEMTEAAKEARRKYEREYWSKHPEKAREKARRYWERKAARVAAEKAAEGTGKNEATDEHELLKKQPEIVRCKDCKHWNEAYHDCSIHFPPSPDWFCADGKRR